MLAAANENDNNANNRDDVVYDDWEDCLQDGWTPGRAFSFVARRVPVLVRQQIVEEQQDSDSDSDNGSGGTLDQLLQTLDPDGTFQRQAVEAGMVLPVVDDIASLAQVALENRRRVEEDAPRECSSTVDVFAGWEHGRGYRVIAASQLLLQQQQQPHDDERTVRHVMDALVSHGCLIVDLGDDAAVTMAGLWRAAANFFEQSNCTAAAPPLQTATETGSPHAKIGYAAYPGLQFLETRLRADGTLLPVDCILDNDDNNAAMVESYHSLARIARSLTERTVAAATQEAGVSAEEAVRGARKLAEELLDDGRPLLGDDDETPLPNATAVSMSPHRLCRYANEDDNNDKNKGPSSSSSTKEIFGAHTDSTFFTAVPVAAVAGLEILDEAAEQWYRPELAARRHWRACALAQGKNDPDGWTESITIQQQDIGNDDDNNDDNTAQTTTVVDVPWHARYAVFLPGELLQLATRNEIMAAVHRVVASTRDAPRLSAPVLFRGRSNQRWDCARYLGGCADSALLQECDGQRMEDIYGALQK